MSLIQSIELAFNSDLNHEVPIKACSLLQVLTEFENEAILQALFGNASLQTIIMNLLYSNDMNVHKQAIQCQILQVMLNLHK